MHISWINKMGDCQWQACYGDYLVMMPCQGEVTPVFSGTGRFMLILASQNYTSRSSAKREADQLANA